MSESFGWFMAPGLGDGHAMGEVELSKLGARHGLIVKLATADCTTRRQRKDSNAIVTYLCAFIKHLVRHSIITLDNR